VWEVAPDVRDGDLPAEPAIEPPIVWEQAGCAPADQGD
jgi:hypothetical protein